MTPEDSNEPMMMNDHAANAWDSAAALGVDMRLLEYTFSLTPDERMRFHGGRLNFFLMLERRAGLELGCVPVRTNACSVKSS
jgi:hypothetical protein